MAWNVAAAKQRLSELLREVEKEPQIIAARDRPVAAVIPAADLAEYLEWKRSRKKRTIAEALKEAQAICADEGYELIVPARQDRENVLVSPRKRNAPRRHQRRR